MVQGYNRVVTVPFTDKGGEYSPNQITFKNDLDDLKKGKLIGVRVLRPSMGTALSVQGERLIGQESFYSAFVTIMLKDGGFLFKRMPLYMLIGDNEKGYFPIESDMNNIEWTTSFFSIPSISNFQAFIDSKEVFQLTFFINRNRSCS